VSLDTTDFFSVDGVQKTQQAGFNHERKEGKDEWLTPPNIIEALGDFDLDPCSPINRPWPTAKRHYTVEDNGLIKPWYGRVWLNPPYGLELPKWMRRMSEHRDGGIALIFARTETGSFFPWIWDFAHSFLFIQGRLKFHHVTGEAGDCAGAPSLLVAYSPEDGDALQSAVLSGKIRGKFLMNEAVKGE
jgi:hypothetical protein